MNRQERKEMLLHKMKLSLQLVYEADKIADCYECFEQGVNAGEQLQREYGKAREFYELVRDYFKGKQENEKPIREWIDRTEAYLQKEVDRR